MKKTITLKTGQVVKNHFESILFIDEKKYILEISFDSKGVIYHFYARPFKSFKDYQNTLTILPSQESLIKSLVSETDKDGETSKKIEGLDVEKIYFDEKNNAQFEFEGHTYRLQSLTLI